MGSFNIVITYIERELRAVLGSLSMPGSSSVFISMFIFIIFSNFIGLCPHIFTRSSHLSITLTLGLPLWLGRMLISLIYQFNNVLAHGVPSGTPGPLIPIIVIIERVRNVIRPGALSIRLAANIVAGHLLLTLLGGQGPLLRRPLIICLMFGLILLILEVGVACIQAYVFTVLSSLYLNELIRPSFN